VLQCSDPQREVTDVGAHLAELLVEAAQTDEDEMIRLSAIAG
jgi:hypothetical protein